MDPDNAPNPQPVSAEDALKAKRARRILYACMAVFIIAPIIVYYLTRP